MRKTFQVVLDCDDVLYCCNEEALQRLNTEEGTSFKMSDLWQWGTFGDARDLRLRYFSDPDFVRSQPLYPGAREFVQKLSRMAEVFICTNVPAVCIGARYDSLLRDIPEIKPENILFGGRKDLLKADMMLDDAVHNLEKSNVTFPVLMQRPWNRSNTGMLSVTGYDEFLELVRTISANPSQPASADSIVLIGPSGSGKTKIADQLEADGKYKRVRTYTTREGADPARYIVVDEETFSDMCSQGCFLETSAYQGHLYGTVRDQVEKVKAEAKIPVLVMDINGAFAIRKAYNPMIAFVKADIKDCIRHILSEHYPEQETVERIAWLQSEFRNEAFCDVTVTEQDAMTVLTA